MVHVSSFGKWPIKLHGKLVHITCIFHGLCIFIFSVSMQTTGDKVLDAALSKVWFNNKKRTMILGFHEKMEVGGPVTCVLSYSRVITV